MRTLVIAAFVFATIASAGAEEKKIKEAEVPKPVLDGVARKYPAAQKLGFEKEVENGKTLFEVKVLNEGHKIDIDVTPDGKIVEEEEEIAWSAAPAAVQHALTASARYGKWTVKKAEKVVHADKPDAPEYEVHVVNGKNAAEVVFAVDGKQLKEETKKAGAAD